LFPFWLVFPMVCSLLPTAAAIFCCISSKKINSSPFFTLVSILLPVFGYEQLYLSVLVWWRGEEGVYNYAEKYFLISSVTIIKNYDCHHRHYYYKSWTLWNCLHLNDTLWMLKQFWCYGIRNIHLHYHYWLWTVCL
jgi:hypothetical protein